MSIVYQVSTGHVQEFDGGMMVRIFKVIENPEGNERSHRINLEVHYGVAHEDEDGSQSLDIVAETVHSIYSDDYEEGPVYDEKGVRIFPMYMLHTNTILQGKLEGTHLQDMMKMMGDDAEDLVCALESIIKPISLNHTAFKHHALAYLEETQTQEGDIKSYTDDLNSSASLYTQMGVLYLIFGSVCTEEEVASQFKPVVQRLKEHYSSPAMGNKPSLKVIK